MFRISPSVELDDRDISIFSRSFDLLQIIVAWWRRSVSSPLKSAYCVEIHLILGSFELLLEKPRIILSQVSSYSNKQKINMRTSPLLITFFCLFTSSRSCSGVNVSSSLSSRGVGDRGRSMIPAFWRAASKQLILSIVRSANSYLDCNI